MISLAFDLPKAFTDTAILRKMARHQLEYLRICREDADIVELLIGELASNAIRHAPEEGYRVEIELSEMLAVITVIDYGIGFTLESIPSAGTLRIDKCAGGTGERTGGFGLVLVRSLADELSFYPNESCGMTVRARKALRSIDMIDHEALCTFWEG